MAEPWDEIPPTAGLPLHWRDLIPDSRSGGDFTRHLAGFLGLSVDAIPAPGITCSGTAALTVILAALQRRAPTRCGVIVPAFSCPLVVLAAARCGLEISLCDTTPNGFDLDPAALARLCNENTLAVLPTHMGGQVAALDPVLRIARQHGAYVIEDAAQALGARENGRCVGLRGDAGFFSLAAGKGLTLYEGGVWIAADPALRNDIAETARRLLPVDVAWEVRRCLALLGYAALYNPRGLRLAYGRPLRQALARGDVAEALGDRFDADFPLHQVSRWRQGIGARALDRLPAFQQALAAQAAARLPRLRCLPGVTVAEGATGTAGVWPLFMVVMPDQKRRDATLDRLWTAGLGVSRMFAHALGAYDDLRPLLTDTVPTPCADDFARRMLTVTNSPWLTDERFARVMTVLTDVCR